MAFPGHPLGVGLTHLAAQVRPLMEQFNQSINVVKTSK